MVVGLIGREGPAGVLRGEIERAAESHGGLVLVTGEAGIGKTSLVTGAVEEARRRGALVVSGSCWHSEGAPGYWPWVQVVRALKRGATEEEWAEAAAAAGSNLLVLLGEAPAPGSAEAFRLYDAVTVALVSVSQHRPVMVVLDDLHWADTASLRLLEFAVQHTWFERVLLVGTYRDVEVESGGHPLEPLITPLLAKATTVTLTGLVRDEVGTLMARTAGRKPTPGLVDEVHRRTGGNPFFVEQTARLWRSSGSVSAIAPGVRDALQRRLSLLPPALVELLTDAAVLGREFHREVLAAVSGLAPPEVDGLLEQAVNARLVVARDTGKFVFAHDLVRETLYATPGAAEIRRRHATVIRALDRSPALAEWIFPADQAHHAYLAGDELDPARVVKSLRHAEWDAGQRMATEEALGHLRKAYEVAAALDPRSRLVIALRLGESLDHRGAVEEARTSFRIAIDLARKLDRPDLLARVALSLFRSEGPVWNYGHTWPVAIDFLHEAHARMTATRDHTKHPNRDQDHHVHAEHPGRAGPVPNEVIAAELAAWLADLARREQDDETLSFSLLTLFDLLWRPGTAKQRAALTAELMEVARRTGDHDTMHFGASLRWVTLLEQGDPAYLDQYDLSTKVAEQEGMLRLNFAGFIDQSIITTLMGRFEEAENYLEQALSSVGDDSASAPAFMANHLRWAFLLLQGRFDELEELHKRLVADRHPHPELLAGITALSKGDVAGGLRLLPGPGADPYPRSFASLGLRLMAQAAAVAGDPGLTARTRAALEPHRGDWLLSLWGCDISGPVDHWLAVLDAGEGRWADAIAGFTAAYRSADRLKAAPWSIEARTGLAAARLARGADGDLRAAVTLLDAVEREAARIGMRHIVDRVHALRRQTGPSAAPVPGGVFRLENGVWSLGFGERTVHMPDAKGLRDLHYLLSTPGGDVPAVRLLDPEGGEVVVAARRMGGDPVLDDAAKAAFRHRLTLLDEEIDQAAALGQEGRAAEFDRERQALLAELRAAAGLAGRDRRLGDEAERARKTVTARIRDTLRKLDDRHPALASHLRSTISTGATCRYQPDREIDWRLH